MKIANKPAQMLMAILLCSITSVAAVAADWSVRPKVHIGIMDYEASVADLGNGEAVRQIVGFDWSQNNGSDISGTNIVHGIGASVSNDVYYLDAYFQSSSLEQSGPGRPMGRGNIIVPQAVDFEREDISFVIGRHLRNNWSIGIGYRNGQTDYSQHFIDRKKLREGVATNEFAGGMPQVQDSILDGVASRAATIREGNLELSGPFISIGKSFPFEKGALGFSLGIADLDGEWEIVQRAAMTREFQSGAILKDSATGVNVGVSWNALITEKIGYSIGADYYSYDFDFAGGFSALGADGRPVTAGDGREVTSNNARIVTEESALTFKFTVGYQF